MAVPIAIDIVLFIIYICNLDNVEYRKVIANVVAGYVIISTVWIMFFLYGAIGQNL